MRSSSPSPSLSNVDWTHTSPLIQSAGFAENTFCDRPFTNVGTAGAGAGAAIATEASAEATSRSPGGSGRAEALVTPTTPASTIAAAAHTYLLTCILPSPLVARFASKSVAKGAGRNRNCPATR